jgi:excisionase family DNA binding protein
VKIVLEDADLAPLIERVVRATIERVEAEHGKANGRLGFTEAEAAELIGVPQHTLRDMRLRGEIAAKKCGKKYIYAAEALKKLLRP